MRLREFIALRFLMSGMVKPTNLKHTAIIFRQQAITAPPKRYK